jgi:hypothetical protein
MTMRIIFSVVSIFLFSASIPTIAVAKKKTPVYRANSSTAEYGFGVSTSTAVTGTATALSGWYGLDEKQGIQVYLGIGSTSPFRFGVGGVYKYTILGKKLVGAHIGGGLGLGLVGTTATVAGITITTPSSTFAVRALGNFGVHFSFRGMEEILFSADSGPALMIASGSTNLTLGAYSALLGLSVHYIF